MSNIQITNAIENALIKGDLSSLTPDQRLSYCKSVCDSVGLNILTKPFEYIQLNGKLTLYATRAATDQLRAVHKVSIKITDRQKFDDIYVVTAQASNSEGRYDESTGAVNVSGLKGEALANAYLKAETKAKRRVTLSLCGLGLLDETEVETIPEAKKFIEPEVINTEKALEGAKIEEVTIKSDFKPNSSNDIGSQVITFGKKMNGKRYNEFTKEDHEGMIEWLNKSGTPRGAAADYVSKANEYINSLEKVT